MDTDEHDRMSILCIACEMVGLVTMVTHDYYHSRGLMHLCSCYWILVLRLVDTAAATVVMVTQPSQDAVENNCPLHVSCYNGHSDVVMLLVNHPEIKINQQVYNLMTQLS